MFVVLAALPSLACGGAVNVVATPAMSVPALEGESRLLNVQQLTHGGNNAEAYFSRSGRQLIFQRQEDLTAGCDQEYVMNTDGSNLRRVSNGLGRTTCGFFYDNDKRILYSSTFEFDAACPVRPDMSKGYVWPLGHFEIYTARADGTGLTKLTDDKAYNAEATVSPDGKRIIFTSTRDGDIDLYTMNIDGSDVRRITSRVGYDGGAFYSPDGKQIVWRASYPVTAADTADYLGLLAQRLVRPATLEIWVANADGSAPRQVTHLGGANFAPFFTHDGKQIIFASNHLDPEGPELRPLPDQRGRHRPRAGHAQPRLRRLPDVQPRRQEAGLGLQPERQDPRRDQRLHRGLGALSRRRPAGETPGRRRS